MAGPSDNGGWSPDGGSPEDLPDLPEEWGVIVIPDDLSELSEEVEAVRAELREAAPPTRWQLFARLPAMRRARRFAATAVRAPVLIISLAVLVTVASLFASAWPGPPRPAATQRPTDPVEEQLETLPALELFGADGRAVPLNGRLPAVILIIDRCDDCADLVAGTIAAVDPAVVVITVAGPAAAVTVASTASTPPTGATPQAQGKNVRELHDPSGTVRSQLKLAAADGTGAALLVDRVGKIVKEIRRTSAAADVTPFLAQLGS